LNTIAIDIGNSHSKLGIFQNDVLIEKKVFSSASKESLIDALTELSFAQGIYCTVKELSESQINCFHKLSIIPFDRKMQLPFLEQYSTFQTLGADRINAIAGAKELYRSLPILIINAGTCITYDIVNSSNEHVGGAISPGWQMRLKAMHSFTSALPLVDPLTAVEIIASDTASCMQSGAFWGMIFEIQGFIRQYAAAFDGKKVFVAGGYAQILAEHLKTPVTLQPDIVLIGLNKIRKDNA